MNVPISSCRHHIIIEASDMAGKGVKGKQWQRDGERVRESEWERVICRSLSHDCVSSIIQSKNVMEKGNKAHKAIVVARTRYCRQPYSHLILLRLLKKYTEHYSIRRETNRLTKTLPDCSGQKDFNFSPHSFALSLCRMSCSLPFTMTFSIYPHTNHYFLSSRSARKETS